MSLELIRQNGLLDEVSENELTSIHEELRKSSDTNQIFRTETEMRVSVLKDIKFPTPDAKYWQAVREQCVMFDELVKLSFDYRTAVLELKKLERQRSSEEDDIEQGLIQVKIDQKNWQVESMLRVAKDRVREIKLWSRIKAEQLPHMKYGTDDCGRHQLATFPIRFAAEVKAMGPGGSPSERRNAMGLLDMALKESEKAGILTQVRQELLDNQ